MLLIRKKRFWKKIMWFSLAVAIISFLIICVLVFRRIIFERGNAGPLDLEVLTYSAFKLLQLFTSINRFPILAIVPVSFTVFLVSLIRVISLPKFTNKSPL